MDTVINRLSLEITGLKITDVIGQLERKPGKLAKATGQAVYRAVTTAEQAEERLKGSFLTVKHRLADAERGLARTGILRHYGIISEQSAAIDIDAERYTRAMQYLADGLEIAVEVLALK